MIKKNLIKKTTPTTTSKKYKRKVGVCSIDGCKNKSYAKGLCRKHHEFQQNTFKQCSIDGCDRKSYSMGLCSKHYMRFKHHGENIVMNSYLNRLKVIPNEFVFKNDICEIILVDRDGQEKNRAIIDKNKYQKIKEYRWGARKDGVVGRKKGGAKEMLHRLVVDAPNGFVVDHINHNVFDNRSINLRICTQQENAFNRRISKKTNTTGYKGVFRTSKDRGKKWVARIGYNGKTIHLGYFKNKKSAAKEYNTAAIKYFGEFACLNIINEGM